MKDSRERGVGETTITSEREEPRTQTLCGCRSSAKKLRRGTIQTAFPQVCAKKPGRRSPGSRVSSTGSRWKADASVWDWKTALGGREPATAAAVHSPAAA